MTGPRPLVDLTDAEARRALVLKWGTVPDDVLPAWVAEMDYALDPVVLEALARAVQDGVTGYPVFGYTPELAEAYAGFANRHYGSMVESPWVTPVVDVTSGVRVALDVLSEAAPVVFLVPGYSPQLDVAALTGRQRVDVVVDPDAERAEVDLDQLDALLAAGARTLLLTQPHNPWGRVLTRSELEGIRDVVVRHRARVVSDEIHAPLVLPAPATRRTSTWTAPTTTRSPSWPPPRPSTPPVSGAPSWSCPIGTPATAWRGSRCHATTPGHLSASWPRWPPTPTATRGSRP